MSLTNPAAQPATFLDKDRDATAKWALFVLTLVYVVNYIDRQIINVLAEPIKRELGLTDTQLGLMTGLVFAIFYSCMAIPIARLAERRNRPRVIAGCLVVWSTCTMLCGAAQTFPQMLLARHTRLAISDHGLFPSRAARTRARHPVAGRADRQLVRNAVRRTRRGLVGLARGFPRSRPAGADLDGSPAACC
jgi:predicted MFS family arabinose efflux permease